MTESSSSRSSTEAFNALLDEIVDKAAQLDALIERSGVPPLLAVCDHLFAKFGRDPIPASVIQAVSKVSNFRPQTIENGMVVVRKYPIGMRPPGLNQSMLVELASANLPADALRWWATRVAEEELSVQAVRKLLGARFGV